MPLDKLVLILVVVVLAAGATVWLVMLLLASIEIPGAGLALIPAALVAYVLWRVISERLRSAEDDHYDNIEK